MTELVKRRRGAQPGNVNAAKRTWMTDGLVRALARDDYRRFALGVEHLARKFAKGERWALEMCFDRIQGRPMPMLPEVDGDGALVVSWVMHATPSTSERSLSSVVDVVDAQQVAQPAIGSHPPLVGQEAPQGEVAADGGVGGGGGTPPHTLPAGST